MTKLKKIQLENARAKEKAPYNFCDRWCERCPQITRDRCVVYQQDVDAQLQCISEGKDPDDWETVIEIVKKNFDETKGLIQETIDKENIRLDDFEEEELGTEKQEEDELNQHPIFEDALVYGKKVKGFVEESYHENEDMLPDIHEAYETLIWYHTLLAPKVHRFLSGLYVKRPAFSSKGEDLQYNLHDAVAQIEICQKSIRNSQTALKHIFSFKIQHRYVIDDLVEMLKDMDDQIQSILVDIDKGKV